MGQLGHDPAVDLLVGRQPPPERRVGLGLRRAAAPRARSRCPTRAPRSSPSRGTRPGSPARAAGAPRGRARRPPRTRRDRPRRSATARRRSRCRARPSPHAWRPRPPRRAPRRASRHCRRCPRRRARPRRSLIRSRNGTPSSGRWFDQRETPVSASTSAGIPNPIASTSGAAARTSSTASVKMSSVSCRSAPAPGPMDAVMHHHLLVDDALRGAWCLPRRCRSRASVAWPVDIQRGVNEPTPGPPEYKVYRSRRKPLVGGGDLDSLRRRLSRHRDDGDEPRPPREKRPITPGRRPEVDRASRSRPGSSCRSSCS